MQLEFDLEFVLKHSVDPLLEHVFAHRVVELVFERFVFKIKLHLVTAVLSVFVLQLNQVEVDLDSAFRDGLGLQRLRELDLVLQHIVNLLAEKHLVDVHFGPLVNDPNHNLAAFLFPHSN